MLRHVTGARVLGLLLMIACAGAAYWMLTSDTFALGTPQVTGDLRYTDAQSVLAAAGVNGDAHPNVVWLHTDEMARAIASFPQIADVHVTTALPNRVDISVAEREPTFALERGGSTFLVDAEGKVLASVDQTRAGSLAMPTIDDQRTQLVDPLTVGGTVDAIDLTAILQLGALTPALLDSQATALSLSVTDDDGFVMTAQPMGWQAIFGQYTPTLRPVDIIPRQVQCLRSLLGVYEAQVRTVYLAPLDERCGTYAPSAAPRVTPTPAPAR